MTRGWRLARACVALTVPCGNRVAAADWRTRARHVNDPIGLASHRPTKCLESADDRRVWPMIARASCWRWVRRRSGVDPRHARDHRCNICTDIMTRRDGYELSTLCFIFHMCRIWSQVSSAADGAIIYYSNTMVSYEWMCLFSTAVSPCELWCWNLSVCIISLILDIKYEQWTVRTNQLDWLTQNCHEEELNYLTDIKPICEVHINNHFSCYFTIIIDVGLVWDGVLRTGSRSALWSGSALSKHMKY